MVERDLRYSRGRWIALLIVVLAMIALPLGYTALARYRGGRVPAPSSFSKPELGAHRSAKIAPPIRSSSRSSIRPPLGTARAASPLRSLFLPGTARPLETMLLDAAVQTPVALQSDELAGILTSPSGGGRSGLGAGSAPGFAGGGGPAAGHLRISPLGFGALAGALAPRRSAASAGRPVNPAPTPGAEEAAPLLAPEPAAPLLFSVCGLVVAHALRNRRVRRRGATCGARPATKPPRGR